MNRTETKKLKENFVSVSILFSLIVCLGICKFGVIPFTYFSKHFKVMFRGIHVNWHCLLTKTKIFRLKEDAKYSPSRDRFGDSFGDRKQ